MTIPSMEQVETTRIHQIVEHVETSIVGRLANRTGQGRTNNTELLLEYVLRAGDGNYLEIGTLFGGSAITVALLKKDFYQKGHVFCVDPLDGYYHKMAPRADMLDEQSGQTVTPQTFFENLKKFKVQNRVFLLRDYSTEVVPFTGIEFAVTYIDGHHWEEVPFTDFELVEKVTTKYIIFDNYDEKHPDIVTAVTVALDSPNWKMCHEEEITCIIERT